jgi:hypothetical protein
MNTPIFVCFPAVDMRQHEMAIINSLRESGKVPDELSDMIEAIEIGPNRYRIAFI